LIFFTADTHFGDPRGIRIDRRPYGSVAEHDAALVARWNEVVGVADEVWHLGDFASARKPERIGELLGALNGVKHLIVGNNDGEATIREPAWASVQHYAELTVEGTALVLCHYPFRTWNKMGRGVVNLHGHSHGRLKPMPRQHDVGVDAWEYRPVPLATILAGRPRRNRSVVFRSLRASLGRGLGGALLSALPEQSLKQLLALGPALDRQVPGAPAPVRARDRRALDEPDLQKLLHLSRHLAVRLPGQGGEAGGRHRFVVVLEHEDQGEEPDLLQPRSPGLLRKDLAKDALDQHAQQLHELRLQADRRCCKSQ
jgi:calcineurin-like phosphoesterase family protein